MNVQLQKFARMTLLEGLNKLPLAQQGVFKLMYGRNGGRRSVKETEAMSLNEVVEAMSPDTLDWAMQQVERSLNQLKLTPLVDA